MCVYHGNATRNSAAAMSWDRTLNCAGALQRGQLVSTNTQGFKRTSYRIQTRLNDLRVLFWCLEYSELPKGDEAMVGHAHGRKTRLTAQPPTTLHPPPQITRGLQGGFKLQAQDTTQAVWIEGCLSVVNRIWTPCTLGVRIAGPAMLLLSPASSSDRLSWHALSCSFLSTDRLWNIMLSIQYLYNPHPVLKPDANHHLSESSTTERPPDLVILRIAPQTSFYYACIAVS